VPYSGKVAVDGINYHGSAQFQFSLEDANGTEHWRNGVDANESIRVFVVNGRYSVMLGGQGMNPLPPELFLQHDELYLSVNFDKGDGPRTLGPEQLITATPRALVAEVAKVAEVAEVAKVAEKLSGAITSDMLSPEVLSKMDANQSAAPMGPITREMLSEDVLADLNKSAPTITSITRDMLPADVLADLNKTAPAVGPITLSMLAPEVSAKLERNASGGISGSITRDMLPSDVLADLNKSVTITREMLPADVLADLNKSAPAVGPITLSMLDAEVTAKLDSNTSETTTVNNPPAVGSLIAIPYGESALAGYSLYQQGTPKELVWEEKAPVSDARSAYDGVEVLDGKIYFVGGNNATGEKNIAERYDPDSNTWDTIASMSVARSGVASAVLNGKLYAIGGNGLSSVEVYDPSTNAWSTGPSLPSEVHMGAAISTNGMIYLIGGINSSNQVLNQVLSFDPSSNQWTPMANMPTARRGTGLAWFQNRIWVIGGLDDNPLKKVEVFNPTSNSWETETNLNFDRASPITWTWKNRLFSAGGWRDGLIHNTIEFYDFSLSEWKFSTSLPEGKSQAGAIVLNDKVYILAGDTAQGVYSNKVYAADLNASVAGVYDLYRKDGNASAGTPLVQAEVADGSVTTAKLDATILKYLKPEITGQPTGKVVYADSNVSFSVTAEGKYLNYQWKKDGVDLTGETNASLNITDANATLHDGNYSVVVSNDFGSVESGVEIRVSSLNDGLLAWWPFDGNGSDMSGNERHSTPTNAYSYVPGKVNQAIRIVGDSVNPGTGTNGGHIIIPYIDELEVGNFAISLWVKEEQMHYPMGEDYINFGSLLNVGNLGQITFNSTIDETIDRNSWNHILLNHGVTTKNGFLNGILVASESWEIPSSVQYKKSAIGRHWWGGESQSSTRLTAVFDDVRIYDRALSAEEVQALYNLGQ